MPRMKQKRIVIFDLDGTIIDAYQAIHTSLNRVLRDLRYPRASLYAVRRAVGSGIVNFMERFVDKSDVKKALTLYRRYHRDALVERSRAIPGTKNVLKVLRRRGYKLAVASNRPGRFSRLLLRHLDLMRYFSMVVCAKDRHQIKPHPYLLLTILKKMNIKKRNALYVGDMALDIAAGRNAGIKAVAVTGGSSTRAELQRARPFKIIPRISALLTIAGEGGIS